MKIDLHCKVCGKSLGRMFSGEAPKARRDHIREEHPDLWAEREEIKNKAQSFYKKTGIGITWA